MEASTKNLFNYFQVALEETFQGYSLMHVVGDNVQKALDGRVFTFVYQEKNRKLQATGMLRIV